MQSIFIESAPESAVGTDGQPKRKQKYVGTFGVYFKIILPS